MSEYAEDALRYGRFAVEIALRAKVNSLLKKHSDVDVETGELVQVDLSDQYADWPKRIPARLSIRKPDGLCVCKRPDYCTEAELVEHVERQNRLKRGIEKEIVEVEEVIKWMRLKQIPAELTAAAWRDGLASAAAALASAKQRRK
jgi:hypothetical protein